MRGPVIFSWFLLSCSYKTKELSLKRRSLFLFRNSKLLGNDKKIKAEIDQEKTDPYDAIIWKP